MDLAEAMLFAFPVVLGAAAILLARWARRREAVLLKAHPIAREEHFTGALRSGEFKKAAALYFFAPVAPKVETLARSLAALVVATLVIGLMVLVFVLVKVSLASNA
jgi:hypothetical protein